MYLRSQIVQCTRCSDKRFLSNTGIALTAVQNTVYIRRVVSLKSYYKSEQLSFQMSSSHSALSRPSEENKLSTTLHQYFLCLPLRGFTFYSCTKSFLEYRCSGIVATLYHHFNFALSLRPCSESNPMSPLTASLQVPDENQKQPTCSQVNIPITMHLTNRFPAILQNSFYMLVPCTI